MDGSPPGPSVHGLIQARTLEWVSIVFSRGNLHDPGIEPGSPALQADYLPSEPLGKPDDKEGTPTNACTLSYVVLKRLGSSHSLSLSGAKGNEMSEDSAES